MATPGALATRDAAEAAVRDLWEAERSLRALAEGENRALRGALQLAAYTFAGAAYEAEIRHDQRVLDRWAPGDWIDFFNRVAPVSKGWSDPAVLAERLRGVVGERDATLAEVRRLQEEMALRAEMATQAAHLAAASGDPPPAPPPTPRPAKSRRWSSRKARRRPRSACLSSSRAFAGPTCRAARRSGISMRLEAAELLGWRTGTDGHSGSIRRVFERLTERGLFAKEVVRVGSASAMFLRLTQLGRQVCQAARLPVRETEYERMLRLHGGERQKNHAAATAVFAYHARKRGWRVKVVPAVKDSVAAPDAQIIREGQSIYVEVELGRNKEAKWRNMFDLQRYIALVALNADGRAALSGEVKALKLPGRATDVQALIQFADGGALWIETWE
ncbi:MAG: hypothetical protein JW900_13975 [Anaerolineae bacterium]|nr:hypothetical protein [Anaerolineae bacterium]